MSSLRLALKQSLKEAEVSSPAGGGAEESDEEEWDGQTSPRGTTTATVASSVVAAVPHDTSPSSPPSTPVIVKRKRGRPRKHPLPTPEPTVAAAAAAVVAPKPNPPSVPDKSDKVAAGDEKKTCKQEEAAGGDDAAAHAIQARWKERQEKKKKKKHRENSDAPSSPGQSEKPAKPFTIPPPSVPLLEHQPQLNAKLARSHVCIGLRVKVRFALRKGKKRWFGGKLTGVSPEGSKVRIKYDDGTVEKTKFPDPDIVVDSTDNGQHAAGTEEAAEFFCPPFLFDQEEEDTVDEKAARQPVGEEGEDAPVVQEEHLSAEMPGNKEKTKPLETDPRRKSALSPSAGDQPLEENDASVVASERENHDEPPVSSDGSNGGANAAPGKESLPAKEKVDKDRTGQMATSNREDTLSDADKSGTRQQEEESLPSEPATKTELESGAAPSSSPDNSNEGAPKSSQEPSKDLKAAGVPGGEVDASDEAEKISSEYAQDDSMVALTTLPPVEEGEAGDKTEVDATAEGKVITPENTDGGPNEAGKPSKNKTSNESAEVPLVKSGLSKDKGGEGDKSVVRSDTPPPVVSSVAMPNASPRQRKKKRKLALDEHQQQIAATVEPPLTAIEEMSAVVPDAFSAVLAPVVRSGRKAAQQANERIVNKVVPTVPSATDAALTKQRKRRRDGEEGEPVVARRDNTTWVQCGKCSKWRVIPPNVFSSLPTQWFCKDNKHDPKRATCDAPEQTLKQAAKERKRAKRRRQQQEQDATNSHEPSTPDLGALDQGTEVGDKGRASSAAPDRKQGRKRSTEAEPAAVPEVARRGRGRPRRQAQPQRAKETTAQEDADNVHWVQCDSCTRWRRLPAHISENDLPDVWYCSMNTWSTTLSCEDPEDKVEGFQDVGIFGTSAAPGKLTYRNLIFGSTGRKANRVSERTRASESLFGTLPDDEDAPPTVMYANRSAFVSRTYRNAPVVESNQEPTMFDMMEKANLWGRLRSNEGPVCNTFETLPVELKGPTKELVLSALSGKTLTGEEVHREIQDCSLENLPEGSAKAQSLCSINVAVTTLCSLVRQGDLECLHDDGKSWAVDNDWRPRYRLSRAPAKSTSPVQRPESRCMKIAKPWKRLRIQ